MALSAPLLTRKRVIKVKIEDPKGDKIAADQALWVEDLDIHQTSPFTERRGTGKHLGFGEEGVIEELSGVCSFTAEFRSNGSNGLEAGLAILLQGCKFKKAAEVYNLHSSHAADKTLSIDVWEDGRKKGLAGASGNVTAEGDVGKRVLLRFEFSGIWQAPIDENLPAYSPAVTPPMMLRDGTFELGSKSIKIGRFSLNMNNVVVPRPDVDAPSGIAYYMITDFGPVFNADPEADLIAGYDYHGILLARTEAAISLVIDDGTAKATFALPKVQIRELAEGDRDGIAVYDYTGQCNNNTGDDAVTITGAAVG